MASNPLIEAESLQKHSTPEDCWLLVNGVVWDFTEFASEHPGGANSKPASSLSNPDHQLTMRSNT